MLAIPAIINNTSVSPPTMYHHCPSLIRGIRGIPSNIGHRRDEDEDENCHNSSRTSLEDNGEPRNAIPVKPTKSRWKPLIDSCGHQQARGCIGVEDDSGHTVAQETNDGDIPEDAPKCHTDCSKCLKGQYGSI